MKLIWSTKHDCWWRPESNGYTTFTSAAGVYTDEKAESIVARTSCSVPVEVTPEEAEILRAALDVEIRISRRKADAVRASYGLARETRS